MRRLGIIVALGALLGMFGGVVTTSSARGPKWQFLPKSPMTLPAELCGFEVGVTFPVNREFFKVLKASADGSVTLLATGSVTNSFTNLETGKTITENVSGPAKITFSLTAPPSRWRGDATNSSPRRPRQRALGCLQ